MEAALAESELTAHNEQLKREEEFSTLQELAKDRDCETIRNVPYDGNCFYAAVGVCTAHTDVMRIKRDLVQYLKSRDEKAETFTLNGFLYAEFYNEFLTWNTSDYGGLEYFVTSAKNVWLPDFALMNSANTYYEKTYVEDFRVTVFNDGYTMWSYGGMFKTQCSLEMYYYPFDLQTCNIEFENWAYLEDEVVIYNRYGDNVSTANLPEESGIWRFIQATVVSSTNETGFPRVTYTFDIQRMDVYYVVNIFLPCSFILTVALGMFFLPADSGEKMSLGITVLLAFSVFQLVIMDNTPQSSTSVPLLTKFVASIMGLTTLSCLVSIVVIYLQLSDATQRPSRLLRVIFFKGIATILCMRKHVPDVEDEADKTKVEPINLESMDDEPIIDEKQPTITSDREPMVSLLHEIKRFNERLDAKEEDETIKSEWKTIAAMLDRLMFWICIIASIVICMIIFVPIATLRV